MDVLEGQKDPLMIRWAVEGSGNPLDFQSEAQKAEREIQELQTSNMSRQRRNEILSKGPDDQYKNMSLQEKTKINPQNLIPELHTNKRTEK